jgi:MbtH protein
MVGDEDVIFAVVVNHEEQYSLWPAGREPPKGWRRVGGPGTKAECLRRIEEVWTDMRPLSLRTCVASETQRGARD